ncbi:hypothetical protein DFH08DRAFT_50169 [Mycena albidolilacea]|uniref:Uncharacterized protein n=1 Tax=Mycena albidolilacea TaxID=1033008 RepID=A0AAD7EYP1_9AGAR|nr:hypothetical protein DFH08DRAFT_50169 [Mycena albidolilacea]
MASKEKVVVNIYFFDEAHQMKSGPHVTLTIDATMLRGMQVSYLLRTVQKQHRLDCRLGHCDRCVGAIFAKSGWLVDKIPETSWSPSSETFKLEHDPVNGIELLEPDRRIFNYTTIQSMEKAVILLCETAFDQTEGWFDRLPSPQVEKRPLESSGEPDNTEKKTRMDFVQDPPGPVRIIPFEDGATVQINLPPKFFAFSSCIEMPGTAFVDKTLSILHLHALLRHYSHCVVSLPPKTGKTTILSMLVAWLDCHLRPEPDIYHLFKFSKIQFWMDEVTRLGRRQPDQPKPVQPGIYKCLIFDLRGVEFPTSNPDADTVERSIDTYLFATIRDFLAKYRLDKFPSDEKLSPLVKKVATFLKKIGTKDLFIGVDHWDVPILRSLPYGDVLLTRRIIDHISQFVFALTAPQELEKPKLLVFGNLGLYSSERTNLSLLKDVSSHPTLDGFFGIIPEELVVLFSRFSDNRRQTLDMEGGLVHKLGYCAAPPCHLGNNVYHQPPSVYNFDLTLNHIATTLNLESAQHRTLADSAWLKSISLCCRHLLQYSSLRRGRGIDISQLGLPDLNTHTTNESQLWQLLLRLGALAVRRKRNPDLTWTLELSSSFAANQLFSQCHPFSNPRESTRDIQLRALLERNPRPIMDAISRLLLYHVHPLDLYNMGEAVFQAIWNTFMAVDYKLVDDGPCDLEEDSQYMDNYFAQLCLFTNSEATRDDPLAHDILFKAGHQRFGFLDIFLCQLRNVRPGRVVAIELKYFSLRGLFRAECNTEEECRDRVYGTGETSTFGTQCQTKVDELAALSEEEIRKKRYHFRQSQGPGMQSIDRTMTIGEIVDAGVEQLQSYMNAIVNGKAFDGADGSKLEGIHLKRETRINVEKAPKTPVNQADELIGYLVYGVGRRAFWVAVEPKPQNTNYRYKVRPYWQEKWKPTPAPPP